MKIIFAAIRKAKVSTRIFAAMRLPTEYKKRPRVMLNSRPDDFEGEKRNLEDQRNMNLLNRHSAAIQKHEHEDFSQN